MAHQPNANDRLVKVRAYLTDETFGYEHWRAAQFSAPQEGVPAVLVVCKNDEDRATVMQELSGPKFPRGKLNEADEGELQMGTTVDGDVVILAFPKPIVWIGMPPEMAEQLADALKARAVEARKNRQ